MDQYPPRSRPVFPEQRKPTASCYKHEGREKLYASPTLSPCQTVHHYLFGCGV